MAEHMRPSAIAASLLRRSWQWLLTAGMSLGAGWLVAREAPSVAVAIIVATVATVALLFSPTAMLVVVFVVKAVIDMLWSVRVRVGPTNLSPQAFIAIIGPVLVLLSGLSRRATRWNPLLPAALVFVSANAVAALRTGDVMRALDGFFSTAGAMAFVIALPLLRDRLPSSRTLVTAFLAVQFLVLATVLAQPLGLLPYTSLDAPGIVRATGLYYHPWDVARYLFAVVPLTLLMLDEARPHRIARWALRVLFALALVVTFYTFLKMAWIVVVAEIALWYWLTDRRRLALAAVAVVVLAAAFPGGEIMGRAFYDLNRLTDAETQGQALSGRVFIWQTVAEHAATYGPVEWAIGEGFRPAVEQSLGLAVHNDYLRAVVMSGVSGLVALLYLLLSAARWASRIRVEMMRRGRAFEAGLASAAACMLAAYALSAFTSDTSTYPTFTWYVWIIMGLVIAGAQPAEALATEPVGFSSAAHD
jgi:hypothetical protein